MMFFDFTSSPQIDTVFYKEDLTLSELLDHENILQELKSQNKKLIDFLVRPEVLLELVTLVTTEPREDLPEHERYKHPHIACELLTTGIPTLNERLIEDEAVLSKLYSFLEVEPPLNPLLASFFSRTMAELIIKRSEQNWFSYQFMCLKVLEFLKSKQSFISLLLKHLGTSAIMDLVLNFVTKVDGSEMKANFLSWMASQRLIESLIELLEPAVSSNLHCNAALLLCDIISKSREIQRCSNSKPEPDPILELLESPETVQKLLNVILGGEKNESSIVGGITVILVLLDLDKAGDYRESGASGGNSPDTPVVVLSTLDAVLNHLPALHDLLLNPPKKSAVRMTCGVVDPPLGNTRLHVIKLLATLISKHDPQIEIKLSELGTVQLLLDLFFRYTWNNFLHTLVVKCLALAINVDPMPSNPLLLNILVKCRLLQRILDAWNDNDSVLSNPGGCRRGYMGHLIELANVISLRVIESSSLDELMKQNVPEEELNAWNRLIEGPIASINKTHEVCLGGKHPMHSNSDEGKEFRDGNFPQDALLQQIYTDYNMQQVASPFIETFGFNEAEFSESDDNLDPSVDRLENMSFNINDDDEFEKRYEMFKEVCNQKLTSHEVDDDFFNFKTWNGEEEPANISSEERPGPEGREEDSEADPWFSSAVSVPAAESPANPWQADNSQSDSSGTAEDNWADFEANFGAENFTQIENTGLEDAIATMSICDSDNRIITTENRTDPLSETATKSELISKPDDNANHRSSPDILAVGDSQGQESANSRLSGTPIIMSETTTSNDSKEEPSDGKSVMSDIKLEQESGDTGQEQITEREVLQAEGSVTEQDLVVSRESKSLSEAPQPNPASAPPDPV